MSGHALDSRLAEIVERLEHSGFAAELWDSQWHLAWVSRELKEVIERLEPADAAALGIDTDGFRYRTLAELDSATEKARRDAGGVAVTTITP